MSLRRELRLCTAADAPACAAIVDAWVERTPWIPRRFDRATFEAMFREAIPQREFWVSGDPVAGYLSFDAEENCVIGLYTAQPGQGHGRALLARVCEGRTRVTLWSHAPNTRAHAFYEREGFARTGRTRDGDDGLPEWEFARSA